MRFERACGFVPVETVSYGCKQHDIAAIIGEVVEITGPGSACHAGGREFQAQSTVNLELWHGVSTPSHRVN